MNNLKHLIGAYFYEAWDEYEYNSWEDAVDDFVRRSPDRAPRVPAEIDALLAEESDERALDDRLVDFGFSHVPPEGDRSWLLAVRDRIVQQTTQA